VIEFLPWILLALLLCLSGFFSASETALFNLDARQTERAGERSRRLLSEPRELLVTILFANLVVNLLFFTSASLVLSGYEFHGAWAVVEAAGALLTLLIVGEILPKTLALRAPVIVARLASILLALLVPLLAPVRRIVSRIIDTALRVLGETERTESRVTAEGLAAALEVSASEGLLLPGEADLLAEIVELNDLRVREIMTPRVDALILDQEETPEERAQVIKDACRRRLSSLPVADGGADSIVGCVLLRDLLMHDERPIEGLVMPVKFVPEVATVLSLLNMMHTERITEAVVVDEWGGTAGIVTLEDVFEELVGELRVEGEDLEKPVVPLGEGRFRVSGRLSIRDWNERFGARVVPSEFETVGGYVTAVLGRIPRQGDIVPLAGGLACEVQEVRGRRLEKLDLFIVGEPEPDEPASSSRERGEEGGWR